jgi:hypothetical protein
MEGVVPRMPALIARRVLPLALLGGLSALIGAASGTRWVRPDPVRFVTGDRCMPCHNALTTPSGADVSIGFAWRASIMANSARDPYWQGSVRREVLDHPAARAKIEDECSVCHMPMQRYEAHVAGGLGAVFAHLPQQRGTSVKDSLAADGVSCTLCHQIQDRQLGEPSSFTGGFVIDTSTRATRRPVFGPYDVDQGHATIMHSSSGFVPTLGAQIRSSAMCATCHTLYTTALGPGGETIGQLPEQVPFLEWKHSAYANERSCQDCHMPPFTTSRDSVAITAVLGQPRPGPRQHLFAGGNFFVLGMLNRYRKELAVEALPTELEQAASSTRGLLAQAARLTLERAAAEGNRLSVDVTVTNLTGHKLPTAYPSRRAWLHLTVHDRSGATVFESGAVSSTGRIVGNDNDDDRTKYEPHYHEITSPDQVEIYESIMVDRQGVVTTGLLSGLRYAKDNRLLPRGFDKATASPDFAVVGSAAADPGFVGGSDRVRYRLDIGNGQPPFRIDAELWYQPIGFRWAENLRLQPAVETDRFVSYYESMATSSAIVLARDSVTVR